MRAVERHTRGDSDGQPEEGDREACEDARADHGEEDGGEESVEEEDIEVRREAGHQLGCQGSREVDTEWRGKEGGDEHDDELQ